MTNVQLGLAWKQMGLKDSAFKKKKNIPPSAVTPRNHHGNESWWSAISVPAPKMSRLKQCGEVFGWVTGKGTEGSFRADFASLLAN